MTYPSTTYPNQKDTNDFMQVIDGSTAINSTLFSKFSGAILAIEKELGIKPSGIYSDVRQRLDALELMYIYGASHSTTIVTNYLFDWISPLISTPSPTLPGLGLPPGEILSTTIGKISINLYEEAGFPDGYGLIEFKNSFYVDQDITSFELSLWETTSTPTQIVSDIFVAGDNLYNVVLSLPITDEERTFEVRVSQTSSYSIINYINSQIWNSRLVFAAIGVFSGEIPDSKYLSMAFDYTDVLAGSKFIGELSANVAVQSVSLIIGNSFDGGTSISVGDQTYTANLMSVSANIPTAADIYRSGCDVQYASPALINLNFGHSGTPTMGSGTVIVYYH